ncbi:MAG: lipocalin family protein [Bacteroidales bacterium]|nr:lipocalin family protein [Bacteroidales bacterium]
MKKLSYFSFISFFVLFIAAISFVSCSADDEIVPDPSPKLTSGLWAVEEFTPTSGTIEEKFLLSIVSVFEDTAYVFSSNGSFVSKDCFFGTDTEGTWSVSADNKFLSLTQGQTTIQVEIVDISATNMTWRRTFTKEELEYTKELTGVYKLKNYPLEE